MRTGARTTGHFSRSTIPVAPIGFDSERVTAREDGLFDHRLLFVDGCRGDDPTMPRSGTISGAACRTGEGLGGGLAGPAFAVTGEDLLTTMK